jgi:hypothetical protein
VKGFVFMVVEIKNKLVVTTPSSRINARSFNPIMWFIFKLQKTDIIKVLTA